jgi:hypothetical protein
MMGWNANKASGTVGRSVATTQTTMFSNVRRARGQSRTAGRSAHCRGVGSQSSIGRDGRRVDAGIARGGPIGFAVRRRHGCSVVLRFDLFVVFPANGHPFRRAWTTGHFQQLQAHFFLVIFDAVVLAAPSLLMMKIVQSIPKNNLLDVVNSERMMRSMLCSRCRRPAW